MNTVHSVMSNPCVISPSIYVLADSYPVIDNYCIRDRFEITSWHDAFTLFCNDQDKGGNARDIFWFRSLLLSNV